jgi:hypothetical protein
MNDALNKYQRYRRRCKSRGNCPHCGQPCAPYYECAERRAYKSLLMKAQSSFNRSVQPYDPRLASRGPIRKWNREQDRLLEDMLSKNYPLKLVCEELGRSAGAIVARSRKLGLEQFRGCGTLLHIVSLKDIVP